MRNKKITAVLLVGLLFLTTLTVLSAVAQKPKSRIELEESIFLTCFAAGTEITMVDGTKKKIEDISKGDEVLSYNTLTKDSSSWVVDMRPAPNLRVWDINDGLLLITEDHPLRIKKQDGRIG